MGGKLSKRKKGYNVSDPKEQKEETVESQVQSQTEEDPERESEPKSEPKPEDASSTAVEAKPTERLPSEAPAETAVKVDGAPLDVPREAAHEEEKEVHVKEASSPQVAFQEPKAIDASIKMVPSSNPTNAAPVEKQSNSSMSGVEAVASDPPQANTQESSGKVEATVASSPPGKVPEEISSAGCFKEDGSSTAEQVAPNHKGKTGPAPAVSETEPEATSQEQKDVSEALPNKSPVEISETPEPDPGFTKQFTGDTETPDLVSLEIPPPVLEHPSKVTAVEAEVSQLTGFHRTTPEVVPDTEDVMVDSAESQVEKLQVKPRPAEPALVQGKTVDNIETSPVSQAETETLLKPNTSMKSPKDTETEVAFRTIAVPELNSLKEPHADEKMESANTEKTAVESLAERKSIMDDKVHDPLLEAEFSTEAEAVAVPKEDVFLSEEEEHREFVNSAGQVTRGPVWEPTAEKPIEAQPKCVNDDDEHEEPPKTACTTNGCDHQNDVDLLVDVNAPVGETPDIVSAAQVVELI
ncbi:titin-like [Scleropages formosus]|uniref:titin-like n=1 Tax=Scleropages formosus TaxID=113540 RepID=UPI000878C2CA|nr:titin-like [Scleropages formosus]